MVFNSMLLATIFGHAALTAWNLHRNLLAESLRLVRSSPRSKEPLNNPASSSSIDLG